jgi:hypothetical protein
LGARGESGVGGRVAAGYRFVTVSTGFWIVAIESMACLSWIGSCRALRGVIGGQARGPRWCLVGLQVAWWAGLVTSRFRVEY